MTPPAAARRDLEPPALAVGVDLVEVARISRVLGRHPVRFLTRHFTAAEQEQCRADPHRLAGRWSGKEAVAKALGTGIGPIRWTEVEIIADSRGAPHVVLHGAAQLVAESLGLTTWALSLSDTVDHAVAVAVATGHTPG